jgi:hypothetical protein
MSDKDSGTSETPWKLPLMTCTSAKKLALLIFPSSKRWSRSSRPQVNSSFRLAKISCWTRNQSRLTSPMASVTSTVETTSNQERTSERPSPSSSSAEDQALSTPSLSQTWTLTSLSQDLHQHSTSAPRLRRNSTTQLQSMATPWISVCQRSSLVPKKLLTQRMPLSCCTKLLWYSELLATISRMLVYSKTKISKNTLDASTRSRLRTSTRPLRPTSMEPSLPTKLVTTPVSDST